MFARRSTAFFAVSLAAIALTACTRAPSPEERRAETQRILALAKRVPPPAAADPAPASIPTTAEGWFQLGVSERADAAEFVEKNFPADATPEIVAAVAMGLGAHKTPAAERVLLALASRAPRVPEALDGLTRHYQARAPQPAPTTLPDPNLLGYATDADARCRAALGQFARIVKDPALLPALEQLTRDPDFEVRRGAAQALAEARAPATRPNADRERCLAALTPLIQERDTHVVIAAARSLASYDDTRVSERIAPLLQHADFNVRTAAIEALARRKATAFAATVTELARRDPSPSVRVTALAQIGAFDPAAPAALVPELLASPVPQMRTSACELLSRSREPEAIALLVQRINSDPALLVRQAALAALGSETARTDAGARDAVRAALRHDDAGLVSTACATSAQNAWKELTPDVLAVIARFTDGPGAKARAAAIRALGRLDAPAHRAVFAAAQADANPSVRDAALQALAQLEGQPPPPPSRGADIDEAQLLPGGAPLFDARQPPHLLVETERGTMRVRLFPEFAPVHCAHVVALARRGFYDGLTWHRIVADFVAQGGCPRGDGSGNAGVSLPLEPTRLRFERGTLGMPRAANPDSGGCQLFLCHSRAIHLDVGYTAFGQIVSGLDVLDQLDLDTKILGVRVEGAR